MTRPKRIGLLAAMVAAVLAGASAVAAAHHPASPGSGWSAIARLPDWRGAWYLETGGQFKRGGVWGATAPQLTPEGAGRLKQADEAYFKRGVNPQLQNCLPDGMPHIMDYAFPIELYFTPGKVILYTEAYGQVRWIYTDARPWPDDLPPSYNGLSIGRWQGDTLAVETRGMIPQTQLVISDNMLGIRHSDQLRIFERMRLIGRDTLEVRTTIDDPVVFAKPWLMVKTYRRRRDRLSEVKEYVCSNNHEPLDENGKQIFLLPDAPK